MADKVPFSPLDPLGPEFGNINNPIVDAKGLDAFEGDYIKDPKINFPTPDKYFSVLSGPENLNRPNRSVRTDVVRTHAVNPSIPQRPYSKQNAKSGHAYLDAFFQANQDRNSYGKIFSYNADPDGNAFYKRYAAYGQKKFDEVGFSPLRDNEANFNARTTRWDDFSRMMSHSFVPLFTSGFVAGPKSLAKMFTGDFTSGDTEDAKLYEEAAAIGQSTKGGVFGFVNNATMNFGYTAGIIVEAIAEEAVGALLAAPTGGASLFAATANNAMKMSKIGRSLFNGYKAVSKTLGEVSTFTGARRFWEAARRSDTATAIARGLNPLENTMDAFKALKQADNFTDLALLSKTAGGFYRDVRNINMAVSEARLEAGMVENHMYDKLYNQAYAKNLMVPSNTELAAIEKQAKDASYDTMLKNTALIYASNAITFNNITSPRGGLRNFFKGTTEDIYQMASKQGGKNFGNLGKVVYNRTSKAFELQKNNFMQYAKNWYRQPVYKSLKSTVGYFKANFTEGVQENLQEVIAGANERYYMDTYKSPTLAAQMYNRASVDLINQTKNDYYYDELGNQISAQGAETFASGFFMGTLAGPLNNAVPFLSTGYNRMFNKEEYTKWKTEQSAIAQGLMTKLNNMDLKTFMSERNFNLGSQDLIAKIRARGTKKEGLDAETEAFVSQVNYMRSTGTGEMFKEKLASYSTATDKEFADAFKIDEDQVEKYRARLNSSIERLDRVQSIYDNVERKYPNPVNRAELTDPTAPDYKEKVLLHDAWNQNIKNMVFFNETYTDVIDRREKIQQKYTNNSNFQSIGSKEKELLFTPMDIYEEVKLLKDDIEFEKEAGDNPKKLKQLNEKLDALSNYIASYQKFDIFFNRADYSDSTREELTKELGRDATAEEIAIKLDEKFGSLDDTELKNLYTEDLKEAHDNYLKTLASHNDGVVFDENATEAFELLMDYYKMGSEAKSITRYINLFNDPNQFIEAVRRNQEWMERFNKQRVKYFEDLINSEMGKVRDNTFLNTLADNGYYLNEEDMIDYLGGKNLPPKEIYNHITKEVYPQNSEEYKKIYAEFFKKRDDLKAAQNPRKSNIINKTYESQIEKVRAEMADVISNLPTNPVKVKGDELVKKGQNKTLSINDIYDQMMSGDYVEAVYSDSEEVLTLFKDEDGALHYDDEDGDIVELTDIKDKFTNANKFTITQEPNAESVKAIEARYNAEIAKIEEAYAADKEALDDEIPYEEVTSETDLSTPDLIDFRNMLYSTFIDEYVPTLSQEEQDEILEDDAVGDIRFENWYKQPENQKYFDDYNKANRPAESAENLTFTTEGGQQINSKNATLEELIRYRDGMISTIEANEEFDGGDDDSTRALKVKLKTLENIIKRRQFANFSPVVKEGVKKIQKLINAQKGVEERFMLTEDDPDTGLKAGEVAYRVNGKIHRRVTRALQDVLGSEYEYKGKQSIEKAYNLTIGKNGLNEDSIDDFISQLKGILSTKSPGYDPLPGTNVQLIDDLEEQLKKLTGLSKEQIDLERAKDKVLKQMDDKSVAIEKATAEGNETRINSLTDQKNTLIQKLVELDNQIKALAGEENEEVSNPTAHNTTKDIILNFFTENTYQDSRDAGNFVDDAKDYLESGRAPKRDPKIISNEAYDSLFDPSTGYLTQLKRKVDSGEFYLIGRDLVVYDSDIMRPDGSIDRIAGEIDLLLATDEGIMIVDIKTGEQNKWFNFNKVSTKDKKVYSKREEYTLQQGAYATMLEKMINAPVANIALLPVQRSSDSETNQILLASKPDSASVYSGLEFEKNPDGTYKRNDQNELVGKSSNKKFSDFFIPLYRDTVKDKLDLLFPTTTPKLIPGLASMGVKQFNIYKKDLETISDKDTEANRTKFTELETKINDFASKNNFEVPDEITILLNEKKADFQKTDIDNRIDNAILKYTSSGEARTAEINTLRKRLEGFETKVSFDNVDLSDESEFIEEQLEKDAVFADRYYTHEKYYVGSTGRPTEGQKAAINVLNTTGIVTPSEYDMYLESNADKEEASELIHEAVKRIQYMITATENSADIAALRLYQKDIFTLMNITRQTDENKNFVSILSNIKDDVDNGQLNDAMIALDTEILKLEYQLSRANLRDNAKAALNNKLADIQKIKTGISSLTNYVDIATNLEITGEEEEGVLEEVDLDALESTSTENNITKGANIFSKSANFTPYTVAKVNQDNTVDITDSTGNKMKITMEELNNNYLTEDQVTNIQGDVSTYEPTPSEEKVIKESLDSVGDYIKDVESKTEGHNLGLTKSPEQIRKEFIEETKNCQ